MKLFNIWVVVMFFLGTTLLKAENEMKLTIREQYLVEIAALEAKGEMTLLEQAIHNGLEGHLTVNEVKEALTQLYAYTGFPRALNGLGVLQRVVVGRVAENRPVVVMKEFEMAKNFDALKTGTRVQTKLCGGKPFNYSFAPRMDYFLKAHLFGDIFVSDILSEKDRELVTIGAISSLEGCDAQLTSHVGGALNMGVSMDKLKEIPSILENKVGNVEAYRLRKAIATNRNEKFDEAAPVDFNVWPKGEPNTAYAQYFKGNSYLAPMDAQNGGPVNVTFEPRCRNNWHIHHKSVQVLICVSGRGWYQEEGKEAVEMLSGSVIAIPAEVKHWHGAAKDSWFQHLTYNTKVAENASNEWLEAVVDEEYDKLK